MEGKKPKKVIPMLPSSKLPIEKQMKALEIVAKRLKKDREDLINKELAKK